VDMKQHTESHALHILSLHPAPAQVLKSAPYSDV
jgi:hypothetical protein